MLYKENGYHLFNLYAFALIKQFYGDIPLFKSDKFKQALSYCFSIPLHDSLENNSRKKDINNMPKVTSDKINIYGYSYNPPGFELPYIYYIFKELLPKYDENVESVKQSQIVLNYSEENASFSNNTEDYATLDSYNLESSVPYRKAFHSTINCQEPFLKCMKYIHTK